MKTALFVETEDTTQFYIINSLNMDSNNVTENFRGILLHMS